MEETDLKESLLQTIFKLKNLAPVFSFENKEDRLAMGALIVLIVIEEQLKTTGKVNISEIQNHMSVSKPAISQIMNVLEKNEYISRTICSDDRRRLDIIITQKGQEMLLKSKISAEEKLNIMINEYGQDNVKILIDMVDKFIDIAEKVNNTSAIDLEVK